MGKILNYKILGTALKSLSDACFKADEQQRNGEKITACGMSDDDLDRLCDIIPDMLNPMLSTEEVKEKLHVSDATLNRMVALGVIFLMVSARSEDTLGIGRSGIFCTSLRVREVSDCLSFLYVRIKFCTFS